MPLLYVQARETEGMDGYICEVWEYASVGTGGGGVRRPSTSTFTATRGAPTV